MRHRMSAVGVCFVFFAVLLAWSGAPVEAAPVSSSQDPAQLSTAAVLLVKFDPSVGTDTILVANRQQIPGVSTPGSSSSAITIHLRFYDADCHSRFDNNITLTQQDVEAFLVSSLFSLSKSFTEPGVVLADTTATSNALFALSGVVIDANFLAVYERQGSPLLQPNPAGCAPPDEVDCPTPVWGGFSPNSIDDWFLGGFTMLQMLCPGDDSLDDAMDDLAQSGGGTDTEFAETFLVNVYDAKEVLKRSNDFVICRCYNDSSLDWDNIVSSDGDTHTQFEHGFPDVIASMLAAGFGTFHWDADGHNIAWRVIGDGNVWWDARLRTTPGTAFANGFSNGEE